VLVGDRGGMRTMLPGRRAVAQSPPRCAGGIQRQVAAVPLLVGVGPGTMNTRDLAVKFDAYRHYVSSGEWAQERSSLPRLLCIAPDIAQERRMHRVVLGRLTHAVGPAVWTTTEVLLKANGPIAPIWMQVTSQSNEPAQVSDGRRSNVFDVHAGANG
jgi:hypothetical protein